MSNAKNLGNDFEVAFKHMCHISGVAVSQIYDGFIRVGAGGLLPKKQACDFVLSFNGKTALVDCKTQGEGFTFAKSHVDQDQLDKMRSHHSHGTITGYIVYFRTAQKVVFFSTTALEKDLRSIEDGMFLGPLIQCDIKKIFTYGQAKPQQ